MRLMGITSIILIVTVVSLSLLQLWFGLFEASVFVKLIVTLVALLAMVVVVSLIRKEYVGNKKLKDDGYID